MYKESNLIGIGINSDKGLERDIFLYDDGDEEKLLDVFKNYANNPELKFTFNHANLLEREVRRLEEKRLKKNILLS